MSNSSPERMQTLYEWQEKDEFSLLLAVQAISQESVENYNPRINLFDRIEKFLNKRFGYEVILSKIKELKKRFYRTRGFIESNFEVNKNKIFLISKDIWGRKENNGELGANRRNENMEAEDNLTDAGRGYRNEMNETKDMEKGAQSVSGNETMEVEDNKEKDGQRDVGDELMEIKDKKNAEQSVSENEMMELEAKDKDEQRDRVDEMIELTDKENITLSGSGNEMMEVEDEANNAQRGVENEMMKMKDKEKDAQRDEMMEMENMEKDTQRGVENEMMEMKDKEKDAQRYEIMEMEDMEKDTQWGVENEIMEMKDKEKDAQRDVEKEMMETNDKKIDKQRVVGNEKMGNKEKGKQRGVENKMMEMKDKEKDAQRDEMMEMEDMEKDTQRDVKKEMMETNDKKNNKQSVKAVQIGGKCSEATKSNSIISSSMKILKHAIKFKHKQKQLNIGGIDAKPKVKCSGATQSNSFVFPSSKILKHAIKFRHKQKQLNIGGIDAKSKGKIQSAYKVLKNRSSMQKDSEDKRLCFRCGKAGHMKRDCTLEKKVMEPLTEEQSTKETLKGAGTKIEKLNKGKEAFSASVLSSMKNRDDELACNGSNECGKSISSVTNKRTLQTVLLKKRKQQQNLKSQPVSKKQNTGVKCYECGNCGHIASSCVQRKVVKHPTKKQESSEITQVRQPETTNNRAVKSSNEPKPIRSKPVPKEHTSNKNFDEKATVSESGSYHHISDNPKAETSGNFKSETTNSKAVESSNETKPIRSKPVPKEHTSKPVPKEHTSNKNFDEKATVSESGSYHHISDNMKEETSGNFNSKTTNNKAVESSNEIERSKPIPKEHTTNKNFEGKATVSESGSYHHTSDNMKAETLGNFKSETTNNKAVESSNETKPIRSKPVPEEHTSNKNFEEKVTVSESGSYHHISDSTKAETSGNFRSETTDNKAVESSNENKSIRSESVSKEHASNKNFEEKATTSKSGSYHQTSDNTKEEISENFKPEVYNMPTLEQRKPSVNESGSTDELASKKNLEEKSISPSGAHCLPPNQLINSSTNSISNNVKPTSEQRNTNERKSNSPHKSASEQRMKLYKCSKFDSAQPSPKLRRESLSNNFETVHHQSSHEHKKELSNSRHIETRHNYNQHYDEWRQKSNFGSPPVHHGRSYEQPSPQITRNLNAFHASSYLSTPSRKAEDSPRSQYANSYRSTPSTKAEDSPRSQYANSYHSTPSRKAEDSCRFQSVSHQYSFESLHPRTYNNYNTGFDKVMSHRQVGYHHLVDQRAREPDYQHFQGQRMTSNFNQDGYYYSYGHDHNGYTYYNRDVARRQSYATQPPLPADPYPYPPPPPPPPSNEPYWYR